MAELTTDFTQADQYSYGDWNTILEATKLTHDIAKLIYKSHPLANRLCRYPISMAISRGFEFKIPNAPQEAIDEFTNGLNEFQLDTRIVQLHTLKKVFGVSSVIAGQSGRDTGDYLDFDLMANSDKNDIYFNVLEPLITAGSIVSSLDPNSGKFLNPTRVSAQGKYYHSSRCRVTQNEEEQADWLDYEATGFGFLARSAFYRAFPLLQIFLLIKLAEIKLTHKLGVLVIHHENPGNAITQQMEGVNLLKRAMIKMADVNNDILMGREDAVEAINLTNAQEVLTTLRDACLTDIATAAGNMPASLLRNESLAQGNGDGTHDKEKEDLYFVETQKSLAATYKWADEIVQRAVWTREFVARVQENHSELQGKSYGYIIRLWQSGYERVFNPPSVPSEQEKAQTATTIVKAMADFVAAINSAAKLGQENSSRVAMWMANNINDLKLLPNDLELDPDDIQDVGIDMEGGGGFGNFGNQATDNQPYSDVTNAID